MLAALEFLLLAVVSLFAIVNPFSTVPAFLAITPDDTPGERIRMARTGCLLAASLMVVLAIAGQWIFLILGITLPALQIAGGLVLFLIGIDMLRATEMQTRLNAEERRLAEQKEDIAISPLAIPLLCGPGAMSTIIILQTQTVHWVQSLLLLLAVPIAYFGCYLILVLSSTGARWLNPIILKVLRRLMGLLFLVIAAQFVIDGIGALPFVSVASGR